MKRIDRGLVAPWKCPKCGEEAYEPDDVRKLDERGDIYGHV